MENKRSPKEIILWRLHNVLKGQAMFIREDKYSPVEDRLEEMKVVEQLVKFLDNYDENVSVLELYYSKKTLGPEQMEQVEKKDIGYSER